MPNKGQKINFDDYSESYSNVLNQGLVSLAGDTLDYYAKMRMESVKNYTQHLDKKIDSIIEWGCGIGNNIVFLKRYFPDSQITGLDISEASLAIARKRFRNDPLVKFELVPNQNIDDQVDLIFINGVLHHIPAEEHSRCCLKLIQDRLKPGALLTLFENNPFNPGTQLIMKMVPFDKDAVMINPYRLLKKVCSHEFKMVKVKFYFIFPKILRFFRFMEPYFENFPIGAQYCIFAFKDPVTAGRSY